MTVATQRVKVQTVDWGDCLIERTTQKTTATTYWPGEFLCLTQLANTLGASVIDHASDAVELKFDGICADSGNITVWAGDDTGRPIKVERPYAFTANIALATLGDEGKPVYILDNQTLAYAAGVVNLVLVGWVDQVILPEGTPAATTSTVIRVRPWWVGSSQGGTSARTPQLLISNSGAVSPNTSAAYLITKAGVAALTLAAPTVGTDDGVTIILTSTTAFAHTLTATGLLKTGSANVNVATFAAFGGVSLELRAYNGFWYVIASNGITFT